MKTMEPVIAPLTNLSSAPVHTNLTEATLNTDGLAERISVLEERTKLKPKSLVDKIKEWGGVATLAIAVAYTFPTGVWQQWFQPEKKAADDIRSMVEQTTMILAEGLKASAGSTDKAAAGQLNRYYTTRAYLVMERYATAIDKYSGGLSPSELLVVGMNFSFVNRPDEALKFLTKSLEIARGKNDLAGRPEQMVPFLQASRMRAELLFAPGIRQDITTARTAFKQAVLDARNSKSLQEISSLLDVQGQWAYMELSYGDWKCGQEMLDQARRTYASSGLSRLDRGQLQAALDSTTSLQKRVDQPELGCT
jgi:tetratricopeptide (TPR) repeat protein